MAFFCFSKPTFAHETQAAGTLEVTVYTEPHDAVRATQPAVIHVDFSGQKDEFSIDDCDCVYTIRDNGSTASIKNMHSGDVIRDGKGITFSYIFPHAGVYTLVVEGAPTAIKLFNPFKLSFPITVLDASATTAQAIAFSLGHHFWHYFIFFSGIIVGFFYALWPTKRKPTS